MIVCHEFQFIFIKTKKTAGTSVEVALSKFCSAKDVITPISPVDEQLRRSLGHFGARNYHFPLARYGRLDLMRLVLLGRRRIAFNHMSAYEVRQLVGEDVWSRYFKFTVERNPWDKVVSGYYWHHQDESRRVSFSDYVLSGPMHKLAAFDQYSLDGRICVDYVIKYENLADEVQSIATRLHMPTALKLPETKAGTRKDRRHYGELYGEKERRAVALMFAREIEAFGYTF